MFKKKFIHPDTGDVLSFSEQVSWKVQGVIRNWIFVIFWSVLSIVWWIKPHWFKDSSSYVHWQLIASFIAVVIELIVGISMLSQTKRDAMIIRHILKLERNQTDDLRDLIDSLEDYE